MSSIVNSSLFNRFFRSGTAVKKGGVKSSSEMESLFHLISEKKTFFILIFTNLFLQLGLTYYTMKNTDMKKYKNKFWILVLSTFLLLGCLIFIPMPSYIKVGLFLAFSYIWGLLLSTIKTKHNEKQIQIAIEGALSIFGAMMLVGLGLLAGGIQLGYQFGLFLFIALLVLIIARLVSMFSGTMSSMQLGFSIFGVILFSLYVLYDTNIIFRRDYYGDFITASMDYYLDILNLFLNLLNTER